MVSEGGMKNALDPSLGSQAPSVAPVLRAVIWLQQRLTLQIDGDWGGWGISKISFCRGYATRLSFLPFAKISLCRSHLPALNVGLQLFQSLQFLHLPFGLIDVGADSFHGQQSLFHCWIVSVLLWGPLQQFLSR